MRNRRYKRAMFKAFESIRKSSMFPNSTKHQALRTIRDFERVNSISFDPFNSTHLDHLKGMGAVGGANRAIDICFKRLNKSKSSI